VIFLLHETWTGREVVTAETMNRRVHEVHRRLYEPPLCRLVGMQRGSDPAAAYQPAMQSGWLPGGQTNTLHYHPPAASPLPSGTVDTTNGFMARATVGGYVWRVYLPEDGLYRVTCRAVIALSRMTTYRTVLLIKGTSTEYTADHLHVFASCVPSRISATHYAGSVEAVVAARAGEVVYSAAGAGVDHHLADDSRPHLSSLTVRWIGRHP
jgi:hypothetical protein